MTDEFKPKLKKSGTTTLGIICRDSLIVAAEKKSSMGYLVASKESEKVIQLDEKIVMTISGLAADGQALARYLRAEFKLYHMNNSRRIGMNAAGALLSNILQGNKFYPYYVQLLMGGYDEDKGTTLFSFDAFGSYEEDKRFAASGSGSPIALGVLEDSYREGMSSDEGAKLAVRAIRAAVERDIASGGKAIDVCVINKSGVKFERFGFDRK